MCNSDPEIVYHPPCAPKNYIMNTVSNVFNPTYFSMHQNVTITPFFIPFHVVIVKILSGDWNVHIIIFH